MLEQNSPNVHTLRFENISAGWEQWIMLSSDRHHDNIHTRRDLEKKHLDLALKRNAPIIDVGDVFCSMNGKYDPRRSQDNIRPEDVGVDYLDRIVKHAAEFYAPYAKLFAVIGQGNHESSVLASTGTDLINSLVHRLNADYGGACYRGGYGGWIRMLFVINKTQREGKRLKYFHGGGGGGPVTRGVIDTNRQAVYLRDVDFVVNGHTHDQYYVPVATEGINDKGAIMRGLTHFVRCGTYKDEYADGSKGWAVEKKHPPKPLGCAWIHLWAETYESKIQISSEVTFSNA